MSVSFFVIENSNLKAIHFSGLNINLGKVL